MAYPSFRAGEAEALLAQIPAGFINDIGLDGRRKPDDKQELSLTVAGVAACRDTEKILSLFLQFIQHAVSSQLQLSSNTGLKRRSSYRYAGGASNIFRTQPGSFLVGHSTSGDDFIRSCPTLPKRPWKKDKLLRQLHLILASEPGLWRYISGYHHGDWQLAFDRRILYFEDIRDLNDYWACRFKPWESSGQVPYPVVAASDSRDEACRPQLLRDHPDLLADVLLGRISDCCGSLTSVVSCPKVDPDIDSTLIFQALRRLEAQGRIRLISADASSGLPQAMLTSEGAAYISTLRLYWDDRILRRGAARNALLGWLYDRRSHMEKSSDIYKIFSDRRVVYSGQFFSFNDISDAASYLQEKNLIDATAYAEMRITATGMDCIEQGRDVTEYGRQHHIEAKGDVVMGDKYEARGRAQIGAMGKNAKVTTAIFNTPTGEVREVDLASLISELQTLRAEMRKQASTVEDDQATVAVGQAIAAAEQGDTATIFAHLKQAGKWALSLATAIGAELVAAALKSVIGY